MNQHVRNLKDLSDNLVGVLDEVSRLESVNQNLYEINNKKLMEMDELQKTVENQNKHILYLISIQKDMKDHVELLFQDVLTSNNLLTLKTDIDLQRDKFLELGRKAPPANLIW